MYFALQDITAAAEVNQRVLRASHIAQTHGVTIVVPRAEFDTFENNIVLWRLWFIRIGSKHVYVQPVRTDPSSSSHNSEELIIEVAHLCKSIPTPNTLLMQTEKRYGSLGWKTVENARAMWGNALLVFECFSSAATALIRGGMQNVLFFPSVLMDIEYAPLLPPPPDGVKDIDVLFVASPTPRRIQIFNELVMNGVRAAWATQVRRVHESQKLMKRSKVWLNVHARTDMPDFTMHRVVQAAGQAIITVSEHGDDPIMEAGLGDAVVLCGIDTIVATCKHAADNWLVLSSKASEWWKKQEAREVLWQVIKRAGSDDTAAPPIVKRPHPKPYVIDCTMFFNEEHLLLLRLRELHHMVDKFVIVEANITHRGKLRDSVLKHILETDAFKPYKHKILYKFIEFEPSTDAWVNENAHRRAIGHVVRAHIMPQLSENQLLVGALSDADELVRPSVFAEFVQTARAPKYRRSCEQRMYFYNFCTLQQMPWNGTILFTGDPGDTQTLRDLRNQFCTIKDAGWHMSYFMSPSNIDLKLRSFCHAEFDPSKNAMLTEQHIMAMMSSSADLFARKDNPFIRVPVHDVPGHAATTLPIFAFKAFDPPSFVVTTNPFESPCAF
jgi:beta-1,4-mannosyl-glycoprotein beta-1,4-N-acetylglucosaminyltransferase